MKIAVPLRGHRFSSHFGGADAFALYTVDENRKEVGSREILSPPDHRRGVFPTWLQWQGATVVMAGGIGPRAAGLLARSGITVVTGVAGDDPDVLVASFLAGQVQSDDSLCHEHGLHDCGHHHGHGGCGDGQHG